MPGVTDRHRLLLLPRYDPHHSLTIIRSLSLLHSVALWASRWSLLYPRSLFIVDHSSACGSILRTTLCRFSNSSLISSLSRTHLSGGLFQSFRSLKTPSFLRTPLSATITYCRYSHSYSHTSAPTTPFVQCASATNNVPDFLVSPIYLGHDLYKSLTYQSAIARELARPYNM